MQRFTWVYLPVLLAKIFIFYWFFLISSNMADPFKGEASSMFSFQHFVSYGRSKTSQECVIVIAVVCLSCTQKLWSTGFSTEPYIIQLGFFENPQKTPPHTSTLRSSHSKCKTRQQRQVVKYKKRKKQKNLFARTHLKVQGKILF